MCPEAESKVKHGVYMGPYAGADYNLTLCPHQSRLEHIYHGQPYARVDLNPMPESTSTLCQSRPQPYDRVDFIHQSGTWIFFPRYILLQ